MSSNNIFWQQSIVTKSDRQKLYKHKSFVLWFTGLSASGKSTIARELEKQLIANNIKAYVLDGDNIRHGLNKDLGFSSTDRTENIRRIGEVSKLLVDAGLVTITSFISPFAKDRAMVRQIFADKEFIEVYIYCPIGVCELRDPKGLYKLVRQGKIDEFTGIDSPYEPPVNPEIIIETNNSSVEESVNRIYSYLLTNNLI